MSFLETYGQYGSFTFISCIMVYAFDLHDTFYEDLRTFGYALYFSVVTFTTLGYGDFTPVGWSRPFAAVEAFNGAFMIALFILGFVKKMTR